jgi:prepilin-type N-terminal cleavage/methylation domain-containing protein
MNRKIKLGKQQKGFTIIEVLIVLAIAGLIVLIVFLAVPALQRNSRNTQRKNDVSALLGAVSEHISNHSGQLPNATQVADNSNLQYYGDEAAAGEGNWNIQAAGGGSTSLDDEDRALIVTAARCEGGAAVQGPARGFVVVYGTEESGGGFASTCQAS